MEASAPPLIWNVAMDGSKQSEIVMHLVIENLMRKSDKLIVSHIYDAGKTYLGKHLKYDTLRDMIDAELMGKFNKEQYKLEFEAKDKKSTIS